MEKLKISLCTLSGKPTCEDNLKITLLNDEYNSIEFYKYCSTPKGVYCKYRTFKYLVDNITSESSPVSTNEEDIIN